MKLEIRLAGWPCVAKSARPLLNLIPKPLLEDLVSDRWLPFVGAGLSRNAETGAKGPIPLWRELAEAFAEHMGQPTFSSPLEAISAYEHAHQRVRLVEKLRRELQIDSARPGKVHESFCRLTFDTVVTTNFDFLLEAQYGAIPRPVQVVIEEDTLPLVPPRSGVRLVKVHGDVNHPSRMIATETDYDDFLLRAPLMATYVANLFISRTPVFIGYSLDDPDLRQIWHMVGARLGKLGRPAYVLAVDPSPEDIQRYARRRVTVIALPGPKARAGATLAQLFDELAEYWRKETIPRSRVLEESSRQALSLPAESPSAVCYVGAPNDVMSIYKESIFPLIRQHGFVPVSSDEVLHAGDSVATKIAGIMARASIALVDTGSQGSTYEAASAAEILGSDRVLIIANHPVVGEALHKMRIIQRPAKLLDAEDVTGAIGAWLEDQAIRLAPDLDREPIRLLEQRLFRPAVISAFVLLERTIRERWPAETDLTARSVRTPDIWHLVARHEELAPEIANLPRWRRVRNQLVHGIEYRLSISEAREIVNGIQAIVNRLKALPKP